MAAALAVTLATAGVAQAKPQQATAAQVRQLMQVTGSATMMHAMMEQMNTRMSAFFQKALPCVQSSYWQDFAGKDAEKNLLDRLIPIYQKHFSKSDMAGLLKFYSTPLGQKVVHEMPKTMREAMQVGQGWGKARMEQMVAKLKQNGTIDSDGKCPAPKSASKSGKSGSM